MKKSRILAASLLILFLACHSCQSPVTFSEPQPQGKPDLQTFPARLRGEYLSSDSSCQLIIGNDIIVRYGSYTETMTRSGLDSFYVLRNDTIFNKRTGDTHRVTISGDSIFRLVNLRDTVFKISDNNILRKWKGYCFVNFRREDAGWEVMRISLQKGVLILSSVGHKEDVEKLNELTENLSDTVPPQGYRISKKQLSDFVKEGGFEEQEIFLRIRRGDR